ncbi:MAG: CHAT domain-containing protein [Leptolyngbya sp. SIO4C1]|nr:CHAT domain-containing protein [Leptolyngbya sp. SIO4C1]
MPLNRYRRQLIWLLLVAVGLALSLVLSGILGWLPQTAAMAETTAVEVASSAVQYEEQGKARYQSGDFTAAIALWQQAYRAYVTDQQRLSQARVLSNLALAYQEMGQWSEAAQAISDSRALLENEPSTPLVLQALAQVLNSQGSLQLVLGQSAMALESWQQAETAYQQAEDTAGVVRARVNQAQALHTLGFHRRALDTLQAAVPLLNGQPDSPLAVATHRRIGTALRLMGQFERSQQMLQQGLAIAAALNLPEEQSLTLLSLGNMALAAQDPDSAHRYYQQAAAQAASAQTQLIIELAQLNLAVEQAQWITAEALWPQIVARLRSQPPNRATAYAYVRLARSLVPLNRARLRRESGVPPDWQQPAQLLATAVQAAKESGDQRAEAYALGELGGIYEQTKQWSMAYTLTEQALLMAQANQAADIAYQWQWQLGRILAAQQRSAQAVEAYSQAVETLGTLRGDLVAVDSDVQFSFRENVESVYRELVALLLSGQAPISEQNLAKARDVIELLQLAQLDNFFKEACLDIKPVDIDQVDQQTAILYSIILGDQIHMILRLPQQPLRHYVSQLSTAAIESTVAQLRQQLVIRSRREFLPLAQQLYRWLLQPAANEIRSSGVQTLAFVLDGPLQGIPMAALHDGNRFLIEDYAIALTPGLKLFDPRPLPRSELRVLAAGITAGRSGFEPLDYVAAELEKIQANVARSKVLLNHQFTREALQSELSSAVFPIIHIATHGQFSSRAQDTFILAWDDLINVSELSRALQMPLGEADTPIELLVLSACETAAGDSRAALGLAGIAVKAGARSTLATLWSIDDEASAVFTEAFYQQLVKPEVTRAQALRQAQLQLLQNPQYQHPIYWAPYVLLGNWL